MLANKFIVHLALVVEVWIAAMFRDVFQLCIIIASVMQLDAAILFISSIHWRAPTKTPSLTVHTYEKRSVRVCTIRKVKSKREQKD